MARKVAYVPNSYAGSAATLPLDEIPDDVKAEVEEIYAALKANPNGRMRADFDTKQELAAYVTQVNSYCKHREVDGVAAPLYYRKSPTKNLPETALEFRVTDPLPDNGTKGIRDATKAANDAAKAAEPAATAPAKPAKATAKKAA